MTTSDYDNKIFALNLVEQLRMRGESQRELARVLGVSSSTVSSWCTGQKVPRMGRIETMAAHFGIPKSALIEAPPEIDLGMMMLEVKKSTNLPLDDVEKAVNDLDISTTSEVTMKKVTLLAYFHNLSSEGQEELIKQAWLLVASGEYGKEKVESGAI